MIPVDRLLHLRDPAADIAIALDGLEVDDGGFVQVIELRVMPVGLGAAEILLISTSPLVAADHRNIVLNIF